MSVPHTSCFCNKKQSLLCFPYFSPLFFSLPHSLFGSIEFLSPSLRPPPRRFPSLRGTVGPSHGCCPVGVVLWEWGMTALVVGAAGHRICLSLSGHCQLLQMGSLAWAYTGPGAKFKASVKNGEGQEGTLPAGRWGLTLFAPV